ncbi:MAG TPA: hypothetical protein PKL13_02270 [bacterium]|nr:hypothetical protein [bacterium]
MITLIKDGINELKFFLKENGISDENIRVLSPRSKKITWTFNGREKECNRIMFFVSPKSLKMYILFLGIQSNELRVSFVSQIRADKYVPMIKTGVYYSIDIEQFKKFFIDMEGGKKIIYLEFEYGVEYCKLLCGSYLEYNPDFLKMMDGIFGFDFRKHIRAFKKKTK